MDITIFAAGSRGDIQPCLALGKGLTRAGYRVRLAAPYGFADFVAGHGVEFFPLRGDVQGIMAGQDGRDFMETGGGNPIKSIRAMRNMIGPIALDMAQDAYQACQDSDSLICLGVLSAFGASIAEALAIPVVNLEPTPLLPTRAFAAPAWPIQRDLGGWHNYASGLAMLLTVWSWYQPFVNDFRNRLNLPRLTYLGFLRGLRNTPMLGAYSPAIIPRPPDWPSSLHITGYLFMDSSAVWQPPADLQNFLEAGNPPVYIGFGSMSGRQPGRLAEIAIEALASTNQRGVLAKGWGGLEPERLPADVFLIDSAPHSWLFSRVSAVVHHGGAGTTAEALRAGVPNFVAPFAFDQEFWGKRVAAIGAGPEPVKQKDLTGDRLASAIQVALEAGPIQQKAAAVGRTIRAEDGLQQAIKVIERYVGEPKAQERKQVQ